MYLRAFSVKLFEIMYFEKQSNKQTITITHCTLISLFFFFKNNAILFLHFKVAFVFPSH